MTPLLAFLPFTPQITSVCPTSCPHATLQEAVDAIPVGGSAIIGIDTPVLDGATVIDEGKDVVLVPYLTPLQIGDLLSALQSGDVYELEAVLDTLDTVTLTNSTATGQPTLTVKDASLAIAGMAVDGNLGRAIDASGSDITLLVSTVFGRGVTSDGGLVRVDGGSLLVNGGGFRDGSAAGDGGLVAVYDADATFALTAFNDGASARGACLYVGTTLPETRRTVVLDQTSFRGCQGSLRGGGMMLEGALDVEVFGSTFIDCTAADGGGLALVGADLEATVTDSVFDSCLAYNDGGGVFVQDAKATLVGAGIARSSAIQGGGIAMRLGGTLELQRVTLEQNTAFNEGGGMLASAGTYQSTDLLARNNVSADGDGGGLWIGGEAVWLEDVRSTYCGNRAVSGGGIHATLAAPTQVHNLRLLDNLADLDGGGLYHSGEPLQLTFANLLGNSAGRGSGAAALTTADLTLTNVLVGYNVGSVAIVPQEDDAAVFIGPTVWFDNERGDLDGLSPTAPGAVFSDPLLDRYVPGDECLLAQDWPTWNSPMRDGGTENPDHVDLDGSRADIGAYGGPFALRVLWETDRDEDGVPQIYDCDDGNPAVNPEVTKDEPYDGIDADCQSDDDFDADGDGFRRIFDGGRDCNDARADIYPGAPEAPEGPEDPDWATDFDCDGTYDGDGDGFERAVESTLDPAEADCNDRDPSIYPGAPEQGPNVDYNCDGFVDGPRIYRLQSCAVAAPAPLWGAFGRRR